MRVSELMTELRRILIVYGNAQVFTEGCDCNGDVGTVELYRNGSGEPCVILARTDGDYASGRQE